MVKTYQIRSLAIYTHESKSLPHVSLVRSAKEERYCTMIHGQKRFFCRLTRKSRQYKRLCCVQKRTDPDAPGVKAKGGKISGLLEYIEKTRNTPLHRRDNNKLWMRNVNHRFG